MINNEDIFVACLVGIYFTLTKNKSTQPKDPTNHTVIEPNPWMALHTCGGYEKKEENYRAHIVISPIHSLGVKGKASSY